VGVIPLFFKNFVLSTRVVLVGKRLLNMVSKFK
jgi:hypothetical protein